MTWEGDARTTSKEWRALRLRILERDGGICHVCGEPGADEVDHVRPHAECVAAGVDPEDEANLAPIHDVPCHRDKSSAEGNRARWGKRRRDPEPHPGIVGGGGG